MNNFEPFVTDETLDITPKARRFAFPVRTELLFLGLILLVIFSGVVIPQILTSAPTQATTAAPLTETPQVITPIATETISDVSLIAKAAFVWDVRERRVLYEKKADTVLPLASITKLMTALVAYELVPEDTKVTISPAAAGQESGGNLQAGEEYFVKELADFALISSYNSAAYTLASAVGELLGDRDPVGQFVAAMNIRADELELSTLNYKNPTGLDISPEEAGAQGSARDVSMLMDYIIEHHPDILLPTVAPTTRLYTSDDRYYYDAVNTNEIITKLPNLLGSKTGYTDLAGGNLTIAFDAGLNHPIIVTVLGSTRDARFSDVRTLVAAVQDTFTTASE